MYTYIPSFFCYPFHLGHHRKLSIEFPVLYSRVSLLIYFIHNIWSAFLSARFDAARFKMTFAQISSIFKKYKSIHQK